MQAAPSGAVLLYGFWSRGLAEMEPCTQRIPRSVSGVQKFLPRNRQS
jgi:hypothetical protein